MKVRNPNAAVAALVAFACSMFCTAPGLAYAQHLPDRSSSRLTADRFSLTAGVHALSARTTVRLDASDGTFGTTLSFENDLGVDGRSRSRDFTFAARLRERHRFEVEQFALHRSGSRSNTRTIRFGDDTFELGWELATFFDTDVLRLGYAYSLVRREYLELGIHAGLHVTDIEMGIRASLVPVTAQAEEFADATAPLPVIGFQGAYQLASRWSLHGRAQIFRLDVDDFDGELNHVALAIEHDTFRHVGVGLAADFFEIDVNSKDSRLLGAFKFQFSGPRLYIHAHF